MVTASLVLALAASSVNVSAYADDLKDKQKKAERAVEHAEEDLHASSKQLSAATTRLSNARSQLVTAKAALASAASKVDVAEAEDDRMQAALEVAEAELAQAEADLALGEQQRTEQRQVVADTVLGVYMEGDPELLSFASILNAETTDDLTMRSQARDVVVGNQTRAYDELKATEVLLQVREDQVADARDDVAVKRQEAADHLTYTQQVQAEKAAATDQVRALVSERSAAKDEAAKARKRDQRKLAAERRRLDQIKEKLRRQALAAIRRNGRVTSGAGVLSSPVQGGYVTSPYGYREHPIYHYWGLHDGTDFGGGCGLPILAAADGKVMQSYWSSVYGNRMVVNHGIAGGAGLATIYNHAARYTVGPGDAVKRGQVIGYVGDTGWSTACHLHFTVLANGNTVDPQNWL